MLSINELARIFGVSAETVHTWIIQGRFIGIANRGDQTMIPEDTLWKSSTGEIVAVTDIIKNYPAT